MKTNKLIKAATFLILSLSALSCRLDSPNMQRTTNSSNMTQIKAKEIAHKEVRSRGWENYELTTPRESNGAWEVYVYALPKTVGSAWKDGNFGFGRCEVLSWEVIFALKRQRQIIRHDRAFSLPPRGVILYRH